MNNSCSFCVSLRSSLRYYVFSGSSSFLFTSSSLIPTPTLTMISQSNQSKGSLGSSLCKAMLKAVGSYNEGNGVGVDFLCNALNVFRVAAQSNDKSVRGALLKVRRGEERKTKRRE